MNLRWIASYCWIFVLSMAGGLMLVSSNTYDAILQFILNNIPYITDGSDNMSEYASDLNITYFACFHFLGVIAKVMSRDSQRQKKNDVMFLAGLLFLLVIYFLLEITRDSEASIVIVFLPVLIVSTLSICDVVIFKARLNNSRKIIVNSLLIVSTALPLIDWGMLIQFPIIIALCAILKDALITTEQVNAL